MTVGRDVAVAPAPAPGARSADVLVGRRPVSAVVVVVIVALQRLVVPGTGVSLVVPVTFVALVLLGLKGQLVVDARRGILYLVAVAACTAATLCSGTVFGATTSLTSLGLLLAVWLPLCFRLVDGLRAQFPRCLELFGKLMLVAAVVCVLQLVVQVAGLRWGDPLTVLPAGWTAADFNLTYPIYYGSSILKSNGFLFLEPSFASQFLAMAILVQILLGRQRWRIPVLAAGLLTTVSGTGIVLLAVGLAVLVVRRGGAWAARAVLAVVVAVVAVAVSPLAGLFAERALETAEAGSSGNTRFVTPFVTVGHAVLADDSILLVGRGAGSVTRDAVFNPPGVAVNYTAVPKLVAEYGIVAAGCFLAFLATVLLWRVPSPTLGIAALVMVLLLSGALLQATVVHLCWLLTGLFGGGPGERRPVVLPTSSSS